MAAPSPFFEKSPDEIRSELVGFPAMTVEAALRFRETRLASDLDTVIVGTIALYDPKSCKPFDVLSPDTRLREELGLDSLTLIEMAFKFDEMLGIAIESREVEQIKTLGELRDFLSAKLGNCAEPGNSAR